MPRIALLGDRDLRFVTHRALDATVGLLATCGTAPFAGFYWCNYGLADPYVERLADAGVVVSARAPDAGVEGIELPDHRFFAATLFQPQIGALNGAGLHPLVAAFVAEAA